MKSFQELVDTYTIANDAVMVQLKNDHGTPSPAEDYGVDGTVPAGDGNEPKLHIEYTVVAERIPRPPAARRT